MIIGKVRSALYLAARLLGDVQAVKRRKVGQRIRRRVVGNVLGRTIMRRIP
jgi:hypothetical protein